MSEAVADALNDFCATRPKALSAIIDKAAAAAKAAEAAKAARELVRRKTVLGSSVLPGKLADCSSSDPIKAEVRNGKAWSRASVTYFCFCRAGQSKAHMFLRTRTP